MANDKQLKDLVREKYSVLALQAGAEDATACCGSTSNCGEVNNIMTDDYTQIDGYNANADLGLGCGLPTVFAKIKEGNTVIDLGSGAGNDCFIARKEVGDNGLVIGIDFTPAMVTLARANAAKLNYNNIQFYEGDIEELPLDAAIADVVVSNCVLNLVPAKEKVFKEIYRVLKPGGHFCISDIVLKGEIPENIRRSAEAYAGCVSGAIQKQEYLQLVAKSGFENIIVQKEKEIVLPDDVLSEILSKEAISDFKNSQTGIYSITVFATKPGNL